MTLPYLYLFIFTTHTYTAATEGGELEQNSINTSGSHRDKDKKGEELEEPAPSRHNVKNSSMRTTNTHNRKVEMEIRRKMLKETMASQGSDDAVLGTSVNGWSFICL